MNKFLELSFMNHIRNNGNLVTPYEECFKPVMEFARERLSKLLNKAVVEWVH